MIISILKKNPELRTERDLNTLLPLIKQVEFFKKKKIRQEHIVEICSELRYHSVTAGEFVFKQNDYGDSFFIIL